jgi:broad specificity phosphatase PhoE
MSLQMCVFSLLNIKKTIVVAHGGCLAAACSRAAPATAVCGRRGPRRWPNRRGLRRLILQPTWPTVVAVAHGGWWSNLINFQTVI